ncbi:MAG: M28 family peptidase [Acidobacteriales bacterium]|nr:M28 family peptidase [Terriglobales bacterium]
MRSLLLALSSVVLLFTSAAQAPLESSPELKRIVGDIMVGGHAYDTLEQLTGKFGARLTGTRNYGRAAEWALQQFKSYGVDDAHLEYWTLAHGWKRGTASAVIVSPEVNGEQPRAIHIASAGWSSSTAQGGAEGEIYVPDAITPEALAAKAAEIKGKIILLDRRKLPHNSELDTLDEEQLSARLKLYGVLAILDRSHLANAVIATTDPAWHGDVLPTPYGYIGAEDFAAIDRALKMGPVRVRVDIQNTVSGPVQVPNIVAEIRGSSRPQEWVLLGAHFDSWDFATGAQDNGAGSAQVMEAARAIADEVPASGKRPARSIRFALFGGEEEGLLGSYAYVEQHRNELANCAVMLNTDNGAGLPNGWNVEGRKDIADALRPLSEHLLRGLNGAGIENKFDFETDHGPFALQGVPALNMWVDMSKYGEVHHLPGDTLEKVNRHNLEDGAALIAVTAYALADADKRLGPQLSHAEVEEMLKSDKVGDYLKQSGLWQ